MIKMHEFSSFGVQVSGFCANSAKFCAVAQLHSLEVLQRVDINGLWIVFVFGCWCINVIQGENTVSCLFRDGSGENGGKKN